MPELPEVETVRRGLLPVLEKKRIVRALARRGDLRLPFPPHFAERLEGHRVDALRRRAKYLIADLETGESLVMHLGMSGRFTILAKGAERPGRFLRKAAGDGSGSGLHDHVVIDTEDATRIVYTDHRRFGLMTLVPRAELEQHPLFRGIGPEPLSDEFTPEVLRTALRGKKTPIKSALLDQRVVAGLGNIYVVEALWRAHISPRRAAWTVAGKRADALVPAIKAVLKEAIAAGGSTLRDYARVDGELGDFQFNFAVYDREGARCRTPGCNGLIRRQVQAGRSSFWCPTCQR
jgi:formamidopyrimidine-DNA glycosylase